MNLMNLAATVSFERRKCSYMRAPDVNNHNFCVENQSTLSLANAGLYRWVDALFTVVVT